MSVVTPPSNDDHDVTRNERNATGPLSNAERQRLWRQRQREKLQGVTALSTAEPTPSNKPKRPKRGGHKPGGSERYQEAKRQAEEADHQDEVEQARKPRKPAVPYSNAVADIIIERLKAGESLNSICSTDDMPDESTVREWAEDLTGNFAPRYVRARELGWLKLADELDRLADGSALGERRFEPGVVQRHRLQIDTRRWLLSKMLPKVFGDKLDVTSGDKPLQQVDAAAAIEALLAALPSLAPVALPAIEVEALPPPAEPEGERS